MARNALRPRRKAKPRAAPRLAADDPFLLAWQELVGAATAAATAHDRVWQLRRRVINTLLVVLFVYRLMFSGNGYTATLAALWEANAGLAAFRCRRPNPSLRRA